MTLTADNGTELACPDALSDPGARAELTAGYRPSRARMLFVGESSPAGGTHFYRGNSGLFRATRDAFARGLPPALAAEGLAFVDQFRQLGCWLVDLSDRPLDEIPAGEQAAEVDAAIARLALTMQELRPDRVVVVLRRIAPAVRAAAQKAGLDERAIEVLPFPTRQWRPVYIERLAAVVAEVLA